MNNQSMTAVKARTAEAVVDNFFTPIGNTKPYFKAAFEGFAGTGKTYTAALVAVGLHKRIKSKKPVVIFDTEKAAKFLKPVFAENGIEVLVRESKSLGDLRITMQKMRNEGISDILIIDSISHVWEGFLKAYAEKVRRTSLQFQDWGIIKPTWKAEFSDPFVHDPYNIIMCGRAGYEYDFEKNEDTGKKELIKTGVKMKVEGETAYEPDMLVLMERFEEMEGGSLKGVYRQAKIIKDRSTLLDGKTFENPTYADFAPSVEAMLNNPLPRDTVVMPESDTGLLFRTEEEKADWRRERDKWLEELDGLLIRIAPGAVGRDKQLKLDLLDRVFGTTSMTAIGEFRPEQIADGYKRLGLEAVAMGIAEIVEMDGRKRLVSKLPPNGNGNGNGNGHAVPAAVEKKPAAKKEAKKK
ncbi:MAG: AAA family ATPase [Candidatus Paceibacterota bacterium]